MATDPTHIPDDSGDLLDAEFDDILRDNRVRDNLASAALEYPMVQFSPVSFGDPWKRGAGMFQEDPYFDVWQDGIREYRRQREAEDALEDELASLSIREKATVA